MTSKNVMYVRIMYCVLYNCIHYPLFFICKVSSEIYSNKHKTHMLKMVLPCTIFTLVVT